MGQGTKKKKKNHLNIRMSTATKYFSNGTDDHVNRSTYQVENVTYIDSACMEMIKVQILFITR